ncbi:MAG: L,D-transpeptidase [Hyphomicrobiales bacterium]|jgi:lipoprotein-anchoring transpeptidase ErfK/SrfK|nr:MAG: L,D-transpeptidase [Hyphomicrobiales bacterium]
MRRLVLASLCSFVAAAALVSPAHARGAAAAQDLDPLSLLFGGEAATPAAPVGPDGRPQAVAIPREIVPFDGKEAPGTVIINTSERRLYYVLGNGQAIRYGVGVGRPGFEWSGVRFISSKREWPDWTPPAQMLRRRPDLPRHMEGGINNPLGARAMYLSGTLYRIHGSNEPESIGQAVSSGCIRMTNDDVVDLYSRVKIGTKVVVTR